MAPTLLRNGKARRNRRSSAQGVPGTGKSEVIARAVDAMLARIRSRGGLMEPSRGGILSPYSRSGIYPTRHRTTGLET